MRFATVNLFKKDVESAGLKFIKLPPDWDQAGFAEAMRELNKSSNSIDLLKMIYNEANPFLDEIIEILRRELQTADAFVSNYIFGNLCRLASSLRYPVVTTFAHNAIPSFRNHRLVCLSTQIPHFIKKPFNKYLWKIADFISVGI